MSKYNYLTYCDGGGIELYETLDDALEDADERKQNYLQEGGEDVESVFVAKITHRAQMCDQVFRDGNVDEDGYDERGDWWDPDWEYKCSYKVMRVEQNPAPDVSMLVEVLEKCREIINPPEQNCSCHIFPPCTDCVDYGSERELADEIDAAIATCSKQGGDL